MGLNHTYESIFASSNVIGFLILHGVLLQRTEIAHLLVKPSSQQSQTYHPLTLQLCSHSQTLLEVIRILISRKIPHLHIFFLVEGLYFRLDAIEISDDSTDIGGVSVFGPV